MKFSALVTAILLVLCFTPGCDAVQVRMGDVSYSRVNWFEDRSVESVVVSLPNGVNIQVGKSSSAVNQEALDAALDLIAEMRP